MPDPAGMSRTEAAEALGLTRKSISNMLGTGRLRRVGWGLVARAQLEELAVAPNPPAPHTTPRRALRVPAGRGAGRDGPAAPYF